MAPPTYEEIRRAPKALLHDHLDGGLRPATIVELAAAFDHWLPADEPRALAAWFREAASSGSLERYLQTFAHTVAVMQAPEALHRVAAECAYDLATDGVVYAEVRFAPEQHLERGLDLPGVVEAVLAGFAAGSATAAAEGWPIRIGTLLTAMRHAARSMEIAELAVRYRHDGPPRPARGLRAGQADPAGAVPVVQRADRRGGVDPGASHRAAARPALPGDRQHRQPADERHEHGPGNVVVGRGFRVRVV